MQVDNGVDIGTVCSVGLNAFEKYKLHNNNNKHDNRLFEVIRHANQQDFEKYQKNSDDEEDVVIKTKGLVKQYNLDMKITDAEWQFDRQRLTISFTAPQRIDFRLLVKDLARTFKTRIELRQISTREEAKRIGGMGSCGRTLCCTSFSCEFSHVTLDHARVQQLSNNVLSSVDMWKAEMLFAI